MLDQVLFGFRAGSPALVQGNTGELDFNKQSELGAFRQKELEQKVRVRKKRAVHFGTRGLCDAISIVKGEKGLPEAAGFERSPGTVPARAHLRALRLQPQQVSTGLQCFVQGAGLL